LRARNPEVRDAASALLGSRPLVRITDLACGTGSTVRALSARLPARQHWNLVDNNPALLTIARVAIPAGSIELNAVQLDLSKDLETAVGHSVDLITMSALLDLVSEDWLQRLRREVTARAMPVYATLTYDGRTDLLPADSFDTAIISAFDAHQRTDKGFGPALGPAAARAAIAAFESSGYKVVHGNSDWVIGPDDRAMQIALLAGWADAVREMKTLANDDVTRWLARRTRLVNEGLSSIRVGHVDFVAFPSAMR
jgi:hypothetical protein